MAEPPSLITQELFDETVLENEECFDLTPDGAASETVEQLVRLRAGGGGPANDNDRVGRLSHLVLSHPSSDRGRAARDARRRFVEALSGLDGRVGSDGTVTASGGGDEWEEAAGELRRVGERCRSAPATDGDGGGGEDPGEDKSAYPYLVLLRSSSAVYTLMSYLGVLDPARLLPSSSHEDADGKGRRAVLSAAAASLTSVLADGPGDTAACGPVRAGLRDAFAPATGRVVCLLGGLLAREEEGRRSEGEGGEDASEGEGEGLIARLLRLSTAATRGCETAKVSFVQSTLPPDLAPAPSLPRTRRGGVAAVVASLSSPSASVRSEACRALASLCRYDDRRDGGGAGGPPATSSAHDHAQEFHRAGAPRLLVGMARRALDGEVGGGGEGGGGARRGGTPDALLSGALTALRVLAVNDEVVQTLVALGVLPLVASALESGVVSSGEIPDDDGAAGGGDGASRRGRSVGRRRRLASSSLGLLRNLCGNDEVKTNLCLGSSDGGVRSVLPSLLSAMSYHPSSSAVQEHGCGALAAMALRRPRNARAVLAEDGARRIVDGMRGHPGSPAVQRQGALAVRNVASRLTRDASAAGVGEENNRSAEGEDDGAAAAVRDAFLCLGAEDVLRNVAGRHQGSVDEAYAALRDLGVKASLVKFTADDLTSSSGGGGGRGGRTMMFGERHNGSFRPVYDESPGLGGRVSEACSSR